MGMDRLLTWNETPEWGPPTMEKVEAVLQEFLGTNWRVWRGKGAGTLCCENGEPRTYALLPEYHPGGPDSKLSKEEFRLMYGEERTRGFEVYFNDGLPSSVITRQADEFTSALADQFAKIISRWWQGVVEWPT